MATYSAQSGRNVVLCDTTGQSEKDIEAKTAEQRSDLSVINVGSNINFVVSDDWNSFFTSINFDSTIKELLERFDQVFICSNNKNAQLGRLALSGFSTSLVITLSLRKTKKLAIKNLKKNQSVDLLFYD